MNRPEQDRPDACDSRDSIEAWGQVSAAQVAVDVLRFVDRVLIALEVALVEALADQRLDMADVRLLMAIDRHDEPAAEHLAEIAGRGKSLEAKLEQLHRLDLISKRPGHGLGRYRLSTAARDALSRIDHASQATLTALIAGLDLADRMRLQGAMHLLSDRFGQHPTFERVPSRATKPDAGSGSVDSQL